MKKVARMVVFWLTLPAAVTGRSELEPEPESERRLTLEGALAAALDHNFDLASSRIRAALPEVDLAIEQSDFRWKVRPNLSVDQTRESETVVRAEGRVTRRMETGALFQLRGEWTERGEGEDTGRMDVRLEQPLFRRYGALDALRFVDAAEHRVKTARWAFQRETETLMWRVVRSYVDVLRQRGRVRRETEAVARAADLARLVQVRKDQGRANGVEVLEMRTSRQRAKLRLRQAEEGWRQARLTLSGLLGRAPEQLPERLRIPERPRGEIPDLREAERLAREHRVEWRRVYADYEEARRRLRLQKREFFPDVRLVADYRPYSTEADEGEWSFGVAAGQDLDGVSTRLQYDRETREVQAALLRISAFELQLIREVRSAHAAYGLAGVERELAVERERLAEERLRLSRALYPLGRVDTRQLREAEEEWVDAERLRVEADLQRTESEYAFWYTLGLLFEAADEESEDGEE